MVVVEGTTMQAAALGVTTPHHTLLSKMDYQHDVGLMRSELYGADLSSPQGYSPKLVEDGQELLAECEDFMKNPDPQKYPPLDKKATKWFKLYS